MNERSQNEKCRLFNRAFYDAEAAHYETRHPEVMLGDAQWWETFRNGLFAEKTQAERRPVVLDLGCGTGFLSRLLAPMLPQGGRMYRLDISFEMLRQGKRDVDGCLPMMGDMGRLPFPDSSLDAVVANSVLHHVADYASVINEIVRVLKPGGLWAGAHEPNNRAFASRRFRCFASLYKRIGGGMNLEKPLLEDVRKRLQNMGQNADNIESDDVLSTVEYHSPLEQSRYGVDASRGFDPDTFFSLYAPAMRVVSCEAYSTWTWRPGLVNRPRVRRLLELCGRLAMGEGNLLRYIAVKEGQTT
jgi:ubiquinone/menaquinone biosynthesis C-methylase UbiE